MTRCHCDIANKQFGEKLARRDLERYRRRGPDATTRRLLDAIREAGMANASLIDVGSGIGVLAQELLSERIARATLVDESGAYQAAARTLAAERGTLDRCTFYTADFAETQPSFPPADVITLDRVVCCYPHAGRLLDAVDASGAGFCGLSYPRDRWYARAIVGLLNLERRLRRSDFRVFVHSEALMLERLREAGFEVRSRTGTFVWTVVFLERDR